MKRIAARAFVLISALLAAGCGGGGGGGISSPATLPPTVPPVPTSSPTPTPGGSTPTPSPTAPPTFAPLFAAVSSQINQFTNNVNSQCPAANYPTKVYAELLPANSNQAINSLSGASAGTVTALANNAVSVATTMKQQLGITGVTLSISYPLLVANPANFPNSTWSTQNYATFLSYYQQVVAGLRAAGLGVNVETNVVFPNYVTGQSFNYNGLTVPMLENGIAEVGQHVLDNLKPDYMLIHSEPSTLVYLTGLSSINDPVAWANFLSSIRSQLNKANSPSTSIGGGADDWQTSAFITNLTAVSTLDFYDFHIYPPDDLSAAITDLQQLRASGKPITITETWDDKEDVSVDGTTGPIDSQTVYVRGSYSLWGSLDAQYINSIVKLARCNNVASIDIWDMDHFYAYVDYNATSASYSYSQMVSAVNSQVSQNMSTGTITPAGYAMKQVDGLAPSSVLRR